MLIILPKTERMGSIPEKDLIALIKGEDCIAYCVLFLKLYRMVILEFDPEMSKILLEKYGEEIPFNDFEIEGA